MKKAFLSLIGLLLFVHAISQTAVTGKTLNNKNDALGEKPALVVGIVIDQMRYDYITRFYSKYSEGGFKRLINEGFSCENANYNYIPTYTAVGHTSIYTGTTPMYHGIISNNWYDKYLKKTIYCVDDDNYATIGANSDNGKKSPYRMLATTITDELHLHQNMKGKVIGIALKDRSSILPAGHTADGAYWYDGSSGGNWITSSFYMRELPTWVQQFNSLQKAKKYLSKPWKTLYDANLYTESIVDDNPYEGKFKGETAPVFPHDLPKLMKKNGGLELIKATPFGNSLTTDFVKAAIIGEALGQDAITDFLTISYSSTDYVGHKYGVDAKETEDTYLRLDSDLASLFHFLDEKVGKGNYTLFLTADHAAVQVPSYLQSLRIPAGYFDANGFTTFINKVVKERFKSDSLIENISNFQLFLNKEKIKKIGLDVHKITQVIVDEAINFKGVYKVVSAETLQGTNFTSGALQALQNGYNQKFSGDVLLIPNPAMIVGHRTGTTHGSGYHYDTHVPLFFYGKGIKHGKSKRYIPIVDIAPTLANLLQISFPSATTGTVIEEVFKE
jgi:predicted AlkP superfamily pyrophosphatase or phosphodiesterase